MANGNDNGNIGGMTVNRAGKTSASFWTYRATSETPTIERLRELGLTISPEQYDSLTPGMKREIARSLGGGR